MKRIREIDQYAFEIVNAGETIVLMPGVKVAKFPERANIPGADRNYYIYGLVHPDTDEVRYIGKTSFKYHRFAQHLFDARQLSIPSPKNRWIKKLKSQGKLPEMIIMEECSGEIVNAREKLWIAEGRRIIGERLLNLTDGGDGGVTWAGKCKPIKCSNGQIYPSIHAAAKSLMLETTNISAMLRGKSKTCGGFTFAFLDQPDPVSPPIFKEKLQNIYCLTNQKTYQTIRLAAEDLGIPRASILAVLRGRQFQTRGFTFRFLNEESK